MDKPKKPKKPVQIKKLDEKPDDKVQAPASKKAAIYVDVEDDLTSIISKIRGSSGSIIALVPPKRVGVLQSIVNLKLLKKEADSSKKELILVTADKTLGVLAASAKLPVAPNLTSEAKLAEIPKSDDNEEIIDGSDQTIDELDKQNREAVGEDKEVTAAVAAIADDDNIEDTEGFEPPKEKKDKPKIPNFSKFRKWLIIGVTGGVLLIGGLIWLIFFATSATITISAKTTEEKIDQPITLSTSEPTNANDNKIQLITVDPVKQTNSIEFTATGQKDIGDKATGTVTIRNHQTPFNPFTGKPNTITLDAGTVLHTSSSLRYTTNTAITISGNSNGNVDVTAVAIGPGYNISSGKTLSVGDYASSIVTATVGSDGITGGTIETITVVQQSDIDKIADEIKGNTKEASARADLIGRFADYVMVIEDSFITEFGGINTKPAIGERADKATATIEITYSMYGVAKDDVSAVLMQAAMKKLSNKDNQTVFDNGFSKVELLSFNRGGGDNKPAMRLVTKAKLGPKLDEDKIRTDAVGKKAHEISSAIKKIDGVDEVEVKFFPFWVNTAPEVSRIHIVKNGL